MTGVYLLYFIEKQVLIYNFFLLITVLIFLKQVCIQMGWKAKGGMFDILPLVLQANGADPVLYELPKELILEVPLKHPR